MRAPHKKESIQEARAIDLQTKKNRWHWVIIVALPYTCLFKPRLRHWDNKFKNIINVLVFTLVTFAWAQNETELDSELLAIVPDGYRVVEVIHGDLNNDSQSDVVLMIKATDQELLVTDEYRGELDLNRRGIIVALRNDQDFDLVVENKDCFYSEDEDGGVYFVPEISFSVEKGKLFIFFSHGRYGYWIYNFRYQGSDFELIGYDRYSHSGPVVETVTSINYLTKMKLVKVNINANDDEADPIFEENWTSFSLENRFKLSEIDDFSKLGDGLSD